MTRNSMPSMPGGARADERGDRVGDGLPAGDRRQRDVVVDGVVGEKCGQLGGPDICRTTPRRTCAPPRSGSPSGSSCGRSSANLAIHSDSVGVRHCERVCAAHGARIPPRPQAAAIAIECATRLTGSTVSPTWLRPPRAVEDIRPFIVALPEGVTQRERRAHDGISHGETEPRFWCRRTKWRSDQASEPCRSSVLRRLRSA